MKKDEAFLTSISRRLEKWFADWLLHEEERTNLPLQDFNKMSEELRAADVLLFKGRARISRAISVITQSHWTHAALYIGRYADYDKDSEVASIIRQHFNGNPDEQLVVESLLGQGMVITSLANYADDSIRLCRPRGMLVDDAQTVVRHALRQIGTEYDLRQLLDMARFVFPYTIMPRRWQSTLFNYKAGKATKTVCSTVLAEAFMDVRFPVIPVIHEVDENISVIKRNPRVVTPRDFDYSPYFEIMKFPFVSYDQNFLGIPTKGGYREMPWSPDDEAYCDSSQEFVATGVEDVQKTDDEKRP